MSDIDTMVADFEAKMADAAEATAKESADMFVDTLTSAAKSGQEAAAATAQDVIDDADSLKNLYDGVIKVAADKYSALGLSVDATSVRCAPFSPALTAQRRKSNSCDAAYYDHG